MYRGLRAGRHINFETSFGRASLKDGTAVAGAQRASRGSSVVEVPALFAQGSERQAAWSQLRESRYPKVKVEVRPVTGAGGRSATEVNWRAVCGECRACRKGEPQYCFATHNATQKMTLEDGTELTPALGIGSFAEKTLVAAGQCTKITADISPEQYAAIGLLECGMTAGLGAVLNTGALKRGESVNKNSRITRKRV